MNSTRPTQALLRANLSGAALSTTLSLPKSTLSMWLSNKRTGEETRWRILNAYVSYTSGTELAPVSYERAMTRARRAFGWSLRLSPTPRHKAPRPVPAGAKA